MWAIAPPEWETRPWSEPDAASQSMNAIMDCVTDGQFEMPTTAMLIISEMHDEIMVEMDWLSCSDAEPKAPSHQSMIWRSDTWIMTLLHNGH
jgi:hypothetical protein